MFKKNNVSGRNFSARGLLINMSALITVLIFYLCIFSVSDAHAWWDSVWQQRMQIKFDASISGADIDDDLSDIPVLLRLHTGNFNFPVAKKDGSDLRFLGSDDKTALKYHIEKFDPEEEVALIWVKVPRITGGDSENSIWMYYGNSAAKDNQDTGDTYDQNQVAVYHLDEQEGNPQDATAFRNNGTSFSGTFGIPSVVGKGVQANGDNDLMRISRSASLNFTNGFTFSAWVKLNRSNGKIQLFSWNGENQSIMIGTDDSKVYATLNADRGKKITTPGTAIMSALNWHHLAVTVEPQKQVTLYLDGNAAAFAKLNGPVPAPAGDIIIGALVKANNFPTVEFDEMRFSNRARSAGWIKAAYQSQGPYGMLTNYMTEESAGSAESGTIRLAKVIMRTITIDGWLIIGTLVLMGFGSLYVFQQKVTSIRWARKENESFSQSFRHIENPLSLHEKDQDLPESSLYRVYRAGCEELKFWMQKKGITSHDVKGLSQGAINSFKAVVEKEAMNESRQLSSGIFILNMSLSGAPFLGLLGTVWGVMNSFAALAESGEASLLVIAPGIAAALSTTLAGLLVAIPALFSYSYLTGMIKDMNADVYVFIDDFIRKLEESNGETA